MLPGVKVRSGMEEKQRKGAGCEGNVDCISVKVLAVTLFRDVTKLGRVRPPVVPYNSK